MDQLPLTIVSTGARLQILVENQGRINYNVMNDFKGILGEVKINDRLLLNWTMTGFALNNFSDVQRLIDLHESDVSLNDVTDGCGGSGALLRTGPTLFSGSFYIHADKMPIRDTYLDPTGWGKVRINQYCFVLSVHIYATLFTVGNCFFERI